MRNNFLLCVENSNFNFTIYSYLSDDSKLELILSWIKSTIFNNYYKFLMVVQYLHQLLTSMHKKWWWLNGEKWKLIICIYLFCVVVNFWVRMENREGKDRRDFDQTEKDNRMTNSYIGRLTFHLGLVIVIK